MISIRYLFEQEESKKGNRKEMKIGIIGYSGQKFDEEQGKKLIELGLSNLGIQDYDIIVSGLTNLGIPKLAYEIATEREMKTVGIACNLAKDYDLFPVDEKILVGDKWGDESETFLNYIEALIKVGGGKQSEEEYKRFKGPKFEFDLPATK